MSGAVSLTQINFRHAKAVVASANCVEKEAIFLSKATFNSHVWQTLTIEYRTELNTEYNNARAELNRAEHNETEPRMEQNVTNRKLSTNQMESVEEILSRRV